MKKTTHIIFDHDGTLVDTSTAPRKIYAGIRDILEFIKSKDIPMYVWTARSRISALESLEEQRILSFFDAVCGGDSAEVKPSTAGIKFLLEGQEYENVIVIGDSIGDIIGGKNFGAISLGVMWSHRTDQAHESFVNYGAYKLFQEPKELLEFLKEYI